MAIDTETTVDAAQRLLFGAWRYCRLAWDDDTPSLSTLDEGLFFEDDLPDWNPDGYAVMEEYAKTHFSDADRIDESEAGWQLRFQGRQRFVEDVIWRAGYERKAHIAFFNAGFDISRIAIEAGATRAGKETW